MKHGVRFIEEYPKFGEVLEKLYKKRELDEWYKETCKKEFVLPKELFSLNEIKNVKILNRNWPAIDVSLELTSLTGEGGFLFEQNIQLRISKILPVYDINFRYNIKHAALTSDIDTWGPPQTGILMDLQEYINDLMKLNGFLELSELYDLHDTVYEWKDLQQIDAVNRRLTLEDAVFVDILELCN